jgi:predicted nucleic acid-binding protein
MYILDTCVFSDYQRNNDEIKAKIDEMDCRDIAITAISILEVIGGWHNAMHKAKLTSDEHEIFSKAFIDSIKLFNQFVMLPYTALAYERFEAMKKIKPAINVRAPDLRIASIAIEANATVITYNARDYKRIPQVQYVEWKSPTN